nr:glutamine synthetase family protein [Salsipaludibacter albus]
MLPDPATFHVLPHAPGTGVVLADVHYPDGEPVAISPRAILAREVDRLADRGLAARIGVELEFHVFRDLRQGLAPDDAGMPGSPRPVELLSGGYQLLNDVVLDDFHPVVDLVRDSARALDLPLRSVEAEMGPSQLEVTLAPMDVMAAADGVALLRSTLRQAARRVGLHVTFMTRPAMANVFSAGWHVHLSLVDDDGTNVFASDTADRGTGTAEDASDGATDDVADEVLSATGQAWLAGLLAHAPGATALTTPTINGYKRYRPHSLAPERIGWGIDNKGAMLRVVGHGPATRIENRAGEAAANPHLLLAAQLACGRAGLDGELTPPPPTTTPYATGDRLPATLRDALDALEADEVLGAALGTTVRQWFLDLKRHEVARHDAHVNDWEQREYFELF